MEKPIDFEWKSTRFSWSRHRVAFTGNVLLSHKAYWLLVHETRAGTWESRFEFEGGSTAACTMATRDLALEGTVLALKDFLQTSLKDLEKFE